MPAANKVLEKMLDRLLASLTSGPSLNCRPHHSRQRVDFTTVAKLADLSPEEALVELLGNDREVKLTGRVAAPKRAADQRLWPIDDADTGFAPGRPYICARIFIGALVKGGERITQYMLYPEERAVREPA